MPINLTIAICGSDKMDARWLRGGVRVFARPLGPRVEKSPKPGAPGREMRGISPHATDGGRAWVPGLVAQRPSRGVRLQVQW
jgi:hypothetical protein